jgi:hypothetical protein
MMKCALVIVLALAAMLIPALPMAGAQAQQARPVYSIDATITAYNNGTAHVAMLLSLQNKAQCAASPGIITISLPSDDGMLSRLTRPAHAYKNVTITRKDGTPMNFSVKEQDGNTLIEVFDDEILLPDWYAHFIVSYDVNGAAAHGLLTDNLAMSFITPDMDMGSCRVTLNLPPGYNIVHVSKGGVEDGSRIIWTGEDAISVSAEYSRLPFPDTPVPLQYVFWGTVASLILGWGFMLKR